MKFPPRSHAIALHVEAAKRLLDELEQQSDSARYALHARDEVDVAGEVDERDRILGELNEIRQRLAAVPDRIAHQYAVATSSPRRQTLSVTG
jgi:hypothetical protein